MMQRSLSARVGAGLVLVPLLAGCTTFSKNGGFDPVSSTAKARLGKDTVIVKTDADRNAVRKRTQALLSRPLTMDDAVQVALLNNPGQRASNAESGLPEADLVLKVADEARRAYIDAVAAAQAANYARQVQDSADAGAELASRMRQAGNFSQLDYARERAVYADAVVSAAKARQRAVAAREKLSRTMGLRGDEITYALPERLPDLPKRRPDLADLEHDARSEVRESYSAYVTSYDVAKHYRDEVVPLRKTISDELLLRYNGMLASVFELLADSREQMAAVTGCIDSLKDYWLAETALRTAVGGRLPPSSAQQRSAAPTEAAAPTSAAAAKPASATHLEGK